MAVNLSGRKPNFKNLRSHALNTTKKKQKLNLQAVNIDGKKLRLSAKELKTLRKNNEI